MSKEKFIIYARKHPEFANYVLNGKTTWQQLYEIYEIYGENNNIIENYNNNSSIDLNSFKDVFKVIKNIDIDSIQNSIGSLQKTISLIQDIGGKKWIGIY